MNTDMNPHYTDSIRDSLHALTVADLSDAETLTRAEGILMPLANYDGANLVGAILNGMTLDDVMLDGTPCTGMVIEIMSRINIDAKKSKTGLRFIVEMMMREDLIELCVFDGMSKTYEFPVLMPAGSE